MNEEQLRRGLRSLVRSYGDADALRSDVRRRLELLEASPELHLVDDRQSIRPTTLRRPVFVAAIACVALLVGALALIARQPESGRLTTHDSVAGCTDVDSSTGPASSNDLSDEQIRFESSSTAPSVGFDLPLEPTLDVVSESDQVIEFSIDSSAVARLLVVLPPADEVGSVDESVEWLTSSLSQTTIESIEVVGASATRVRLAPEAGMERVGFRFGPNTFISASGLDRVYEALLLERSDGGVLVVWTDASPEELELASEIASRLLCSVVVGA